MGDYRQSRNSIARLGGRFTLRFGSAESKGSGHLSFLVVVFVPSSAQTLDRIPPTALKPDKIIAK
jgi:hypothetical protein